MEHFIFLLVLLFGNLCTSTIAGLSPVHDLKEKINLKLSAESYLLNSPHKVFKHLDTSILKATKNVTQNPQMGETLYQISKDLVAAILSKLEIQDKITRITKEALEAPGKNKGISAIETRRILDYISRTLSSHMLSITKVSTEPELHRLVYGLAQIAAEVSIVAALKDITYATALSKKQSVDLSLRKKRSIASSPLMNKLTTTAPIPEAIPTVYNAILNKSLPPAVHTKKSDITPMKDKKISPFSVVPSSDIKLLHFLKSKPTVTATQGFLNQTVLDMENKDANKNDTDSIVLEKTINGTHLVSQDSQTLDAHEYTAPGLTDDLTDHSDTLKNTMNSETGIEMDADQPEVEDNSTNEQRAQIKLEKLEVKAKKAILFAGDVAYLTAASVVALRRALTASIEVQMSVKYAKNGMSNHQDLMMNLAKTAAQQAGKEAKIATFKSLACERVIKLALKYTAQSNGANLNHVANRIVMDTLSLSTLAKSMAFVSSDIAINSLYQATDVKPPS